jgi:hypothetical protein
LRHAQPFGGSAEAACIGDGSKDDQAPDQPIIDSLYD